MLLGLKVKNFAIIEDISIQFDEGMTVLTGETGAGKSLIIDAISLLMGERASKDLVRKGEKKAFIQGVYNYENKVIDSYLRYKNIEVHEDLNLTREIFGNGKSILKVNNEVTSLQDFKEISKLITDIHLQHDNIKFFNEERYIELIDTYDFSIKEDIKNFQVSYKLYLEDLSKYKTLINNNTNLSDEIDFITFRLEELKELRLSKEEFDEIANKIEIQSNYDNVYNTLNQSSELISKEVVSNMYQVINNFDSISKYKKSYDKLNKRLNNIYYELEDISNELTLEKDSIDFDPNELSAIKDRFSLYQSIKRRYNKSIDELDEYVKSLEEKVEQYNNFDIILEELKLKIMKKYNNSFELANIISNKREVICRKLEKLLIIELNDLDLINISVNLKITTPIKGDCFKNIFNEQGFDLVEFYISTNKNEDLKLLSKIASGGELSRVMLSLKSIFSKKQNLSTIILDEIDTGVSGETSFKISTKIKSISKHTQLLCITHMPQVAAAANNHIYIYKEISNDRVITKYKKLNNEEKINEIAKMINGVNIDYDSIEHAKKIIKAVNKL